METIGKKILSVTERMMNKKFVSKLNLFERVVLSIFMYLFLLVEIMYLLVAEGVCYIIKGVKWVIEKMKNHKASDDVCIHDNKRFCVPSFVKSLAMVLAFVLCISLFVGVMVAQNKAENARVEEALENASFEYVVAGRGEGQYYTWWEIAETYCPSFMYVANYGMNENCNFLHLLYEYNGGYHTLQRGEVVCVPILE